MKTRPAITPHPEDTDYRQLLLLIILFVVMWLTQLRFPPLSYPHIGLLLLVIAVALTALLPYQLLKLAKTDGIQMLRHPALLPGSAFVAWTVVRWVIDGMPATGAAGVGTTLWAAAYFLIGTSLVWLARQKKLPGDCGQVLTIRTSLVLLSVVGLLCGIHAVWQYHVAYADAYRELLAAIGNRAPDRTELGLLHHLKLRRVASIWGDPNSLATFSAIAICCSLELIYAADRLKAVWRLLAGTSIVASLAAIYYSGSRGGVLDVAFVFVAYGAFLAVDRYRFSINGKHSDGRLAGILLVLMMLMASGASSSDIGAAADTSEEPAQSGWVWRSSTITERLYYLQVGGRMIAQAPLVGLGPGSVEIWFGRLKPPEAREARHLHNWLIQFWAELGLMGVGMAIWFLTAIGWRSWRAGLWRTTFYRPLVVIFFLMLLDGLIQISWYQRELLCIFGLVCGLITGASATSSPGATDNMRRKVLWASGSTGLVLALLLLESPQLAARSNKQMARDATYAGDAASAEKYWLRASRWTPADPEPLVARASLAVARGNFGQGRALIEKALKAQPHSAATHALAAEIYQQLRQNNKVDFHLTKALELYPSHSEYNYQYSRYLTAEGRTSEALSHARIALLNNYRAEDQDRYIRLVEKLETSSVEGLQP